MKPTIGWLGLGNMGMPMATNLLKAGYEVTVYNRTRSKAESLQALGATIAESPQALAAQVDVVITMVSDGQTLESVFLAEDGVLAGLRRGQTVIDMSTVAPETTRKLAALAQDKDAAYLDAPVSGSVKPAEEGTLVILVGGNHAVYERHLPIFEVLGKQSFYFGENGQGNNAKLVVNMMLGITLQGLSEALVLGAKTGLDRQTILEMIAVTASGSPIVKGKTANILTGNYEAAFALKHMEKDFGLAIEAAKKAQAALPQTAVAHQTYVAAQANGLGEQDIMAILLQLEAMSGLR